MTRTHSTSETRKKKTEPVVSADASVSTGKPAQRAARTSVGSGKKGSSRKTSQVSGKSAGKPVSKPATPMSKTCRNLWALVLVLLFAAGFYYWGIRPYSYRWKRCDGRKEYGVCIPCGYDIHGIDISHHQGEINWDLLVQNRAAKFPLHFIFMKATEGGDYSDDNFAANFQSAQNYGFIRGAYHFFLPATDAQKQADFFIRTVRLEKGDLPPVLDIEVTGKKSKEELQRMVKVWLDKVEAHYGVKPILYTSYKFKQRYLNDSIFNTYPYWIAHYYVDSVQYKGKWHFWQHTDVGTVLGIQKEVDLNVFNGSLDDLRALTVR